MVIVGQRNTDQTGAENEDKKGRLRQQLESIQHQQCPDINFLPLGWSGRVRKKETENAQHKGSVTCHLHNTKISTPSQSSDRQPRSDPTDRSPHANLRKINPLKMSKSNRISQSQGRHVAKHVR